MALDPVCYSQAQRFYRRYVSIFVRPPDLHVSGEAYEHREFLYDRAHWPARLAVCRWIGESSRFSLTGQVLTANFHLFGGHIS